ncbi:hypothetical protein, partial [Cytobacillus praedii]|uniref:hypothetical protein n=1 Tax=Cytobacillus praedii TaxID=1742358 RepID=UPI0013F3A91D
NYTPTDIIITQTEIEAPYETLILQYIDSEGYHFNNTITDEGAFIPLSEAYTSHVNNLKIGELVTMTFSNEGDIITVNGKEVIQ